MATVSCDACKSFVHDMKTGRMMMRGDRPQRRRPGVPTPCEKSKTACPKKSPNNERYCVLSDKNRKTLSLFMAARSTDLILDHEKSDPIIRENFAILGNLLTQIEQRRNAESVGVVISQMMV